MRTNERTFERTHPWINFAINTQAAPARLWLSLGEARSKCEHLAGVPLKPWFAQELHKVYLAKGVHATTAIEGNTLDEKQVKDRLEGKRDLPQSQEYLGKEVDNVIEAANNIMGSVEQNGPMLITVDEIKNFNRLILRDLELDDYVVPGEFRKVDVGVMDYKAAPYTDLEFLMERLCEWLNGPDFKGNGQDGIVFGIIKAIVSHVYVAWIHPFGDGNGRTARLLEVRFLMEAGIPSAAIHLLSNHYNATRSEYYRRLSETSKSGGDLNKFFHYAVTGFVDLLKQQLATVKFQQWSIAWESYVYEIFGETKTNADRRRRDLVIALSRSDEPVARSELRRLTPEIAEAYSGKTSKTLTRDLNDVRVKELITIQRGIVRANKEIILAFLPRVRLGDVEAQLEESARLTEEGGQLGFDF